MLNLVGAIGFYHNRVNELHVQFSILPHFTALELQNISSLRGVTYIIVVLYIIHFINIRGLVSRGWLRLCCEHPVIWGFELMTGV